MNDRTQRVALAMLMITSMAEAHGSAPIPLSDFNRDSGPVPAPWQSISISEKLTPTRYSVIRKDNVISIHARANNSMSLLGRSLAADMSNTPILCWRWQIDAPLRGADMARKSGDDYAARVYVALKVPAREQSFATRAKLKVARAIYGPHIPDAAINYVWDNRYPPGTRMANAYTDLTQMIVATSGEKHAGQWVEIRRDMNADIVRAFPGSTARPVLLAVASDTDNTGESAQAFFADFHLVPRDQQCRFPPLQNDSRSN